MTHFHYHSFPRRWRNTNECNAKGIEILSSIVRSGLLLTPERVEWPGEFTQGHRSSRKLISYHKRICFTYLIPTELKDHAREFGPFSIEFDNWELRTLGGIPVIYVPAEAELRGYLGVGLALAHRLGDFQSLLERLKQFLEVCELCKDKFATFVCVPVSGGGVHVGPNVPGAKMIEFSKDFLLAVKEGNPSFEIPSPTEPTTLGGNVGCAQSILQMLTWGIQSYDVQLGNIQAFSGFLYPSERTGQKDLLSYYRQREWRIVGSMTRDGDAATRSLNTSERERAVALDPKFFNKPIALRDGKEREILDECVLLSEVDQKHVLAYARRIVCPASAKPDVEALLHSSGYSNLTVDELEAVGAA